MDRQSCFLTQKFVKPPQQRASACEDQSPIHKVRRKLGRTALQRNTHGIDNRRDRFKQRFAHFLRCNHERFRQTSDQIAPLTSTLVSFSLGYAEPILILISSAVRSPTIKL